MSKDFPYLASYNNPASFPGLDWNFIGSCDPIMIYETKDFNKLQQFTSSFGNSKLTDRDKSILSHPLAYNLTQLLQVTMKYMFDCQEQLKSEIEALQNQNALYKEKVKLLTREKNRSDALAREGYHNFEKCPVCGKKFKSIKYVDNHIVRHHHEHLLAWKSLRINNPINPDKRIQELQSEIVLLKDMLNKQNVRFMQVIQNFNAQLAAQKRDFKQKKQVVPTMEYIDSNQFDLANKNGEIRYPPLIPEDGNYTKFNQTELYIEQNDFVRQKNYENIPEAIEDISTKAQKDLNRMHCGLGSNYLTPKQVENILRYDNPTYQHFYESAKLQLEKDFPMPDPKNPTKNLKKYQKRIFAIHGNSDASSSVPQLSESSDHKPVLPVISDSDDYNDQSSSDNVIRKEENNLSNGEVKSDNRGLISDYSEQ